MKSHFLPQKVTATCAVAGATTLLSGVAHAQSFVAADYASNPIYSTGWSAGQNGGYGFGPWSFDGSNTNPPDGPYQFMSAASPLGASWTLGVYALHSGLANAGRAINEPGGLQPGQTFETVIQNPSSYVFFRGFDILFCNATNNDPGGDGAAALRLSVFGYYDGALTDWAVTDGNPYNPDGTSTTLSYTNTAAAGLRIDLTLTSATNYSLAMTPLNGTTPYTLTGQLAPSWINQNTTSNVTELPVNFVSYRLWNAPSSGTNDITDNFEITGMTIEGLPLNIQLAGTNAVLSWSDFPGFYLESATSLGPTAIWTSNSISPNDVNGEDFVTNPITGHQQFFRLEFPQ